MEYKSGTAFLPVPLDNLFPEDLPAADAPIYYEAFDRAQEQQENPHWEEQYTDDPNKEPFGKILSRASACTDKGIFANYYSVDNHGWRRSRRSVAS